MTKLIENIQPKAWKSRGQVHQRTHDHNFNAEISKGAIRIFGHYGNDRYTNGPEAFDLTFRVGDEAVYGSYNLIYTGSITSIGSKTVTIFSRGDRTYRLDLEQFIKHNWDYDAARIAHENFETGMYI